MTSRRSTTSFAAPSRCPRPMLGFVLCAALLVTACLSGAEGDATAVEGVPILELAPTPAFLRTGGVIAGDSVHFFRVAGGAFLPSGDVAVAVRGESRIVYLDDTGELVATFGRAGSGPGEFRTMSGLFETAEGFALWDLGNRRVSMFGDRALAREFSFSPPSRHDVVGILDEGMIVTTPNPTPVGGGLAPPVIVEGETRMYTLRSTSGEPLATLSGGPEPPEPAIRAEMTMDGRTSNYVWLLTWCLGAWQHAVRGNTVLAADVREGVVLTLGADGEREVLHRQEVGTVTPQMARELEDMLARMEQSDGTLDRSAEREFRDRIGTVGNPRPALWRAMALDHGVEGRIWLRRTTCFGDEPAEIWDVVDRHGSLQARVSIPSHLRVLAVRDDRVLVVSTDALGIEAVGVYLVPSLSSGPASDGIIGMDIEP